MAYDADGTWTGLLDVPQPKGPVWANAKWAALGAGASMALFALTNGRRDNVPRPGLPSSDGLEWWRHDATKAILAGGVAYLVLRSSKKYSHAAAPFAIGLAGFPLLLFASAPLWVR